MRASASPPACPCLPPPARTAGGPWKLFKGQPGKTYTLYTDGTGVKLDATFGAGGFQGKATFIRAITLTRKSVGTSATLVQQGNKWVLKGGLRG